jgi:PLP dependent protein
MSLVTSVTENLTKVKNQIAAAAKASRRDPTQIRLVAVTKKVSVEKIREAYATGLRDFAENYLQEALLKMVGLGERDTHWHFIGHLQSNKVKSIADRFALIHSVDRPKIVDEMAARSTKPQPILLEVNLGEEESKDGVSLAELPLLIEHVQKSKQVLLQGLMFMPPPGLTPIAQGQYFSKARELREQMAKKVSAPHSLLELSMGTSHDFEAAIREGATIVRLGTIIFGERNG